MIHGAHAIIFSKNPEKDRDFFREILKYRFAEAGPGWQIFALPPAEVAFHPADEHERHELYLMCDDVQELIAEMGRHGIATAPVQEQRWGLLTQITLPSGGKLGVYEPRHASPIAPARAKGGAKRAAKKPAAKKTAAKKTAAKKTAAKKVVAKKPGAKSAKKRAK